MLSRRLVITVACVTGLGAAPAAARAQEAFTVIVNASNPAYGVTPVELSELFLKRLPTWADGTTVDPVDLPEADATRAEFTRVIHGRSVDAVAAYWRQQAFAGRAVPPVVRQTAAEVTAFVAANPLAIGYVPAGAALPASVKALPLKTAERGTVYEVEDVEPPTLLTSPPLRYPPLLRRDGVEGHVVLEFVVLADGRVAHDDIQVVEASDRRFGEAAISVIRGTRFRPARREGDAVAVRVRQRVQFSLAR